MKLIILLTLLQQLLAAKFNFTEYTHVSKAFDGTPCLTGCSPDFECHINWNWEKRNCRTFEVAPIYLTTQKNDPLSKYCLSNCGFFGQSYEWCITTEDLKWDYCSSYVSKTFFTSGKPLAQTRHKYTCSDPCRWYDVGNYYWCNYLKNDQTYGWEYCAPPALPRVPVLSENFFIGEKKKGNCDGFMKYISLQPDKLTAADAADNYVTDIANAIEESVIENSLTKVYKVLNTSIPIDNYTMITIGNLTVPAVIRAHITNETIKADDDGEEVTPEVKRKPRDQMTGTTSGYKASRLIGGILGGPNVEYNVVPRPAKCNGEEWWDMELEVRNWCEKTGGSVDMTVVVFYQDTNTPVPVAFGVSLVFKNDDNSIFVDCREKIHYNFY